MSDPGQREAGVADVPSEPCAPPRLPRLDGRGLSESARMARICELLSKAILRSCARGIVRESATPPRAANPPFADGTTDSQRILGYLALVGEANSATMRETLGLTKMQVYRAILPLMAAGRVVSRGQSRMTTYVLGRRETAKIQLN